MKRDEAMKLAERGLAELNTALQQGASETLVRYLDVLARFHRYSFGNVMLIASQKPDAMRVAGFHTWRKLGRWVKKDEQGIAIFAPMVALDNGRFLLWYCGSQGFAHDLSKKRTVDERVYKLGLATSKDGKRFEKHPDGPVFSLDKAKLSILTPCVLRLAPYALRLTFDCFFALRLPSKKVIELFNPTTILNIIYY